MVSQLLITPDHLAWLVQNDLTAFQAIANYLASPNLTAFERQALSAYAALVATGQTTLPLRQFMTLYSLVYQQLTPALGLTADEAFHLLGEDNGALAQEIKLFLEEAASTQDQAEIEAAQVAANILIDLSMVNRENGPFDIAYQGVMDQFAPLFPEEQLDECCIGANPFTDGVRLYLNAREEAFMLRTANPGWSERKIWLEAFKRAYLDATHTALDILGLFPGLGEPADLINGVLYTIEGDGTNALLSYGAAIPFAGWVATGAKYATILIKIGNKTYKLKNYVDAAGKVYFSHQGKLRKILGMGPAASDLRQAHHIVPEALWENPLVQKAAKSGDGSKVFHMNGPHNGVPVPNTRHNGSHPAYSQEIEAELLRWDDAYPNATPDQAAQRLRQWQQTLKSQIENSTQHINDIIPPQIPPL
ncbi:MAG: AHH domain-containing protein [Saprospiraceae bacterium]|nr:AHH domain-containing protein [Saprospiraceae bacterium]